MPPPCLRALALAAAAAAGVVAAMGEPFTCGGAPRGPLQVLVNELRHTPPAAGGAAEEAVELLAVGPPVLDVDWGRVDSACAGGWV